MNENTRSTDVTTRRILAVEDDDQFREVLRLSLGAAGFDVVVAPRGDLGWELYQQTAPDLVLLDSMMPGLSGPEVCARIKASTGEAYVPVLFLTAVSDVDSKVAHFGAGADDFLTKSVPTEELLARVRAHLRIRELNAEVLSSRRRLEELDRLKSTLLASVSHALRTPLHGIRSYTSVLLEGIHGPLLDEQRADLLGVDECARHLGSMIDSLIELGQLEAGFRPIRVAPVSPLEIAERASAVVSPIAQQKGLSLSVEGLTAPEAFATDGAILYQVLASLLGNAVRYTDRGEVRVTLESVEPSTLSVTIRDTGRGIAEDHLRTLLDLPVHELSRDRVPTPGRLGFGLAIARRLLQLVRGAVEIRSRVGEGTTVVLRFPSM